MRWQAVFFDLDGTLVPMDMAEFTNGYFKGLVAKLAPFGYEPKALVDAVWAGTKAMVKNEGPDTNETVFWRAFSGVTGLDAEKVDAACLDFYEHEFHAARAFTRENPDAAAAVAAARACADAVVLASNPIFPLAAQTTRLSWVGLAPEDFDRVTSYETQTFCKPNPAYYRALLEEQGLEPARCLMVGNDEMEDMYAATQAGMQGFLVTGSDIPCEAHPWDGPRGTMQELIAYLEA